MSNKFIPNSFMVANAFVDEAMNKISDASVKIYLLIIRKTRGWTKESDALSLRQLESLSRKSRPTVIKCLTELEEVGLIKKHHQSKYGNVFSPVDNYDIGNIIKFPSKKVLVKTFVLFKKEVVKNFYHFGYGENTAQNAGEFYLNLGNQKSVLVKNFYHFTAVDKFPMWLIFLTTLNTKWSNILTTGGKEFLPQVVKNFNPQTNTIKKYSQNKKESWFVLKTLKDEIALANDSIPVEKITDATWFTRELSAFENFNEGKNHSQQFLTYLFADWLIRAYFKYEKQAAAKTMVDGSTANGSTNTKREPKQLTEKQISAFAQKLAHLPEFASKHSAPGDSYEQLASRIKIKLMNPAQAKKWEPYLKQVGFTGMLMGATA